MLVPSLRPRRSRRSLTGTHVASTLGASLLEQGATAEPLSGRLRCAARLTTGLQAATAHGRAGSCRSCITPACRATVATMSSTFPMAPLPTSPHARRLATGGTTTAPKSCKHCSCRAVTGCSHIFVFIAGASIISCDLTRQHRATRETRLSLKPMLTLARVFADRGAKSSMSAHCDSSTCRGRSSYMHRGK
jgi:hypothetical protein